MFLKILIFKILYFLKLCPIFVGSVHNFGNYDHPKWSKNLGRSLLQMHLIFRHIKKTEKALQKERNVKKSFKLVENYCFVSNNLSASFAWVKPRTTDTWWLDLKFSTTQIHLPIPNWKSFKAYENLSFMQKKWLSQNHGLGTRDSIILPKLPKNTLHAVSSYKEQW